MCRICKTVNRKARTENWMDLLCNNCYTITEHFTWKSRWSFIPAEKPKSL